MELIDNCSTPSSGSRTKAEYRLKLMGCLKRTGNNCTVWQLFNNNNVIIRTYNKKITIHLFGDLDHYMIKELDYKDFTFECNNEELIKQFLK